MFKTGICIVAGIYQNHTHRMAFPVVVALASELAGVTSPVMRLEMMSGRMSIFSILMRISPGKETMVRAELSFTCM